MKNALRMNSDQSGLICGKLLKIVRIDWLNLSPDKLRKHHFNGIRGVEQVLIFITKTLQTSPISCLHCMVSALLDVCKNQQATAL